MGHHEQGRTTLKTATTLEAVREVLSRHSRKTLTDSSLTPAGVTVLVYPKDGEYCVLLNKRSDSVENHKGEISFPGGRKEDADRDLLETALRETHEEMGVRPQDVDVLGQLDDVATNSNYVISAFVGAIPSAYPFRPNADEVAEVIEVPLGALAQAQNVRDEVRLVNGELVNRPSYVYEGHMVYGATAMLLTGFLGLTDGALGGEDPWKTNRR
jgi:8-oxo-dGTP pyrophosphatase MutT (NUDIX family)